MAASAIEAEGPTVSTCEVIMSATVKAWGTDLGAILSD
jgi:hypothetical protein